MSDTTNILQSGIIYRDHGRYLNNDTCISFKDVERIIKNESPTAYIQWKKANGLVVGASVCTGVGTCLALGSLVSMIIVQAQPDLKWEAPTGILALSAIPPFATAIGLGLGAAIKYNKAIDIYNSKYEAEALQLNFFTSPSEVGIALSF